ncbi:MAG: response regulator [Chitinophagaceae bacterium]
MQQKILLVDDREDNLFSMETILEQDGYSFVKATSGRQVLKILLSQTDFALILMDVKMPNLNGFETAALIYEREKLRNIPIIFITAYKDGEENIFKGYRTGAVDYIYKPINPDLLRAKVAVFVDLYRKNARLVMQEQKLKAINQNLENEIHERKASEKKIKQLNHQLLENIARLESANKDLDRFAFMASHDLQEPLRKIRTFSDLLYTKYKNVMDSDGSFHIKRIQNAAERMQELIKDILTFSKLSDEKEVFEKTDLNHIIREIEEEIEGTIRDKNARLVIHNLPSLEVNPGLMRPLFANLINNALKYSRKNVDPIITIRAEYTGDSIANTVITRKTEPAFCRIFIEDNGIGFEQQYAEQIFEMFRRLHHSSEFEGTGIGLALCKKIVEKHNGYISALSQPGEGSTFIIALPVKQVFASTT